MPTRGTRLRSALLAAAAATIPVGTAPPQSTRQDGVDVTFLANEGVMLSAGGAKVLIDGLFIKYETGYAVPADSTQSALASAQAPFDGVDLILVTHRHGDHYHPSQVAAHLRANPQATLLTSQHVIDSLRGRLSTGPAVPATRIMSRTTTPGSRRRETVNGITVELLGLPHGGRRQNEIEHLGYIVEIGGRRVLHTGDAEHTERTLAPFRLDTARIDVALIPDWVVKSAEGREVIAKWIRPRQVVAIHVPEGREAMVAREVRAALPGAHTFVRSLETRRW